MYHSEAFYIHYLFKFLFQALSSMVRTIHIRLMRYRLPLGIRVLVLIALFLSCYGCQKRDYAEAVDAIEARLTMIEQRITQLEKMEQRISAYEFQLKALRESIARLDNRVTDILEAPQTIKGQSTSQGRAGYYLVHRGDSLYGIAQEYGLTVEELRRLNNLTKGHVIYPGQKLLVNSKHAQ
jgi:LysM repeat protein